MAIRGEAGEGERPIGDRGSSGPDGRTDNQRIGAVDGANQGPRLVVWKGREQLMLGVFSRVADFSSRSA